MNGFELKEYSTLLFSNKRSEWIPYIAIIEICSDAPSVVKRGQITPGELLTSYAANFEMPRAAKNP